MRISDWSSDVCSSDLAPLVAATKCSVVAQSLPERSARSIAATCPAMRRARFSRASLFSRCAITYPPILYLSLNQRVEKTVGAVEKWRVERQAWVVSRQAAIRLPQDRKSTRLNYSH